MVYSLNLRRLQIVDGLLLRCTLSVSKKGLYSEWLSIGLWSRQAIVFNSKVAFTAAVACTFITPAFFMYHNFCIQEGWIGIFFLPFVVIVALLFSLHILYPEVASGPIPARWPLETSRNWVWKRTSPFSNYDLSGYLLFSIFFHSWMLIVSILFISTSKRCTSRHLSYIRL